MTVPVRCILNGLQRSGTHLLEKAVRGLGVAPSGRAMMPERHEQFGPPSDATDAIDIGLHRPRAASRRMVQSWLAALPEGTSAMGHMPWSRAMADLVGAEAIRMVTIVRDPRDVVVSYMHHVAANIRGAHLERYLSLSEPERCLMWIRGKPGREHKSPRRSVRERSSLMLAWSGEPWNRMIRFERLVGAEGGGSDGDRREEVLAIADHLAIPCAESRAAAIGRGLFGGTATFRRGMIGSWRQAFTPEVTQAFKAVAGTLLVELGYERDLSW